MNWKKITLIVTAIVIPLFLIVVLVYDAFAVINGGSEASISSLIISFSYKMPMAVFLIAFIMGFFCGHLFWRMRSNKDTEKIDKDIK